MTTEEQAQADKFRDLLKSFNRGVGEVTVEYGFLTVCVRTRDALLGVASDLQRSRAFKSVVPKPNNVDGGYLVLARIY